MSLYSELAGKQEKMKEYLKAIELLEEYLKVLEKLMASEKGNKTNNEENQNNKTVNYLKIADLYYLNQDYEKTLETLDKIDELKTQNKDKSTLSVSKRII